MPSSLPGVGPQATMKMARAVATLAAHQATLVILG
jgi:hypothetical protein